MLPRIYQVETIGRGVLSVMAKPVAGEWIEEEFNGLKLLGIEILVSLLEDEEAKEVGLELEKSLCRERGIEFILFPIKDRNIPSHEEALLIVSKLHKQLLSGKHIAIHCRAGIGRTGIIASAILMENGLAADEAMAQVSKARGVKIPDTQLQVDWLYQFQDRL